MTRSSKELLVEFDPEIERTYQQRRREQAINMAHNRELNPPINDPPLNDDVEGVNGEHVGARPVIPAPSVQVIPPQNGQQAQP